MGMGIGPGGPSTLSRVVRVAVPGAERTLPPEATVGASATRRRMMEATAEVGSP
jgi:hypothetical protein